MSQHFVRPEDIDYPAFRLAEEEAFHLRKVLRAREGSRIMLFDGTGNSWYGIISKFGRDYAEGEIIESLPKKILSAKITLCFSITARNAFEDIIERCTAAGISVFHPVITERSQQGGIASGSKEWQKRIVRIRQIMISSCRQCDRADLPEIREPSLFKDIVFSSKGMIASFGGMSIDEAVRKIVSPGVEKPDFSIFVGPEGGFTQQELEIAEKAGIVSVSLGNYVLRAEDACFYAVLAAINSVSN